MNVSLVGFMRMVMEELDELVWINLDIGTLALYLIRALQELTCRARPAIVTAVERQWIEIELCPYREATVQSF